MIYVVTYNLESVLGPGGFMSESRDEVMTCAVTWARQGLASLDDYVNLAEWYGDDGEPIEGSALWTADDTVIVSLLDQISDAMRTERHGYVDVFEYPDLFEAVKSHDVEAWASDEALQSIRDARKAYLRAISIVADEWAH